MSELPFDNDLSANVWASMYRFRPLDAAPERSVAATWKRVAAAVAAVETRDRRSWERQFLSLLDGFGFLPGGRILAGAGTEHRTTLFNCFVMGFIEDSMDGIFARLKEAALTMQMGGGIGCDFSTLRPRGASAQTSGTIASGPVSFMGIWDAMCATLLSTGARRGAMMGTLRCDHPDIEEFVDAKREPGRLTNFNLSVQVTDAFMHAVAADESWPLVFPSSGRADEREQVRLRWSGVVDEVACAVHRRVSARVLWRRIMDAAYDTAEPGVLFVDTINRRNNLRYCERITSTNPCGEIPLPPYGACNLGSINLTAFVIEPFSRAARLDLEKIAAAARMATRFLDNVIDLSNFPLDEQAREARETRRVGLGITGLGDALIMLGCRYDSDAGRDTAREILHIVRDAAYEASVDLARERGAFPRFDRTPYLEAEFVGRLPAHVRDGIARFGIRNSHLLAIAPTGTISLLANNVSSGIEPVYAAEMTRRVRNPDGGFDRHEVVDHAVASWRHGARSECGLPPSFVAASELPPEAHLQMQAALQPFVDNSISKTINVPERIGMGDFGSIYRRAFELGLKGCTVFRPNRVTGSILSADAETRQLMCCVPEREAD